MTTTKAAQIAAHINAHGADRPYDYKQIAEAKAFELKVGLYWIGTASNDNGLPQAEVWQKNDKGEWTRKMGALALGHDNIWRA